MTQDKIINMAENAELVVSKHSVWTPEKKEFTYMGHTVEGDLVNLMQFAELVARAEREACAMICEARARDDTVSNLRRTDAAILAERIRNRGNHD